MAAALRRTLGGTRLVHSEHSFVVTGDAGFQVPFHVDLALVEHLCRERSAVIRCD